MYGHPGTPSPAGAHFLVDRSVIAQLTAAPGIGRGDLVADFGAGFGALTAPLARTGATVLAIERDPKLAGRLQRRFRGDPCVRVIAADLRDVPLPGRPFFVVASPPFGLTTVLCRRLLDPPDAALAGADLILGLGAARWLAGRWPRDARTAWWAARFQLRLVRRIWPDSFSPPPSSGAAYLQIRPRQLAWSPSGLRVLHLLIKAAYRSPHAPVGALAGLSGGRRGQLGPDRLRQVLADAAIDRRPAGQLTAADWALVAAGLAGRRPSPTGPVAVRHAGGDPPRSGLSRS